LEKTKRVHLSRAASMGRPGGRMEKARKSKRRAQMWMSMMTLMTRLTLLSLCTGVSLHWNQN